MRCITKSIFITSVILLVAASQAVAEKKIEDRAFSAIRHQIDLRGAASVLVELTSEEMRLSSADIPDAVRKAEVALVQQRLRSSLSAADRQRIIHQYEFVPGIAMLVDTEALRRLQQNEFVKAVFENGMRKPSLSQSTGLVFSNQAASPFTGNNEWAVAVLDTGVDKNHSFLQTGSTKKVISEACYSRGGYSSEYPEIDSFCPGEGFISTAINSGLNCTGYANCSHGTHVAGIAAGDGDSFDGVARLGKIIAVQVFTGIRDVFNRNVCGTGFGQNCIVAFDIDILRGLERIYALRNTHKIAAVNMSLGGGDFSGSCDLENSLITNAVNNLKNAGIATVVASGNEGHNSAIAFPACISGAVAVGATYDINPVDTPTAYSNESGMLDLYAPGSFITSSLPGGSFATWEGTSMAAPHVAGAWAVLKHAKPQASVTELETLLKSVGPNVTSRNGAVVRKRLDLRAALPNAVIPPILIPLILRHYVD